VPAAVPSEAPSRLADGQRIRPQHRQIRCRAFGMFRMRDAKGPDPKVLCVPTADPRLAYLSDLEPFDKLKIQHSFEIYQDLEPGKTIDAEHGVWADRADAEAEVGRSRRRAVRAAAVVDERA
jgi:inorganic pyrophosphatase